MTKEIIRGLYRRLRAAGLAASPALAWAKLLAPRGRSRQDEIVAFLAAVLAALSDALRQVRERRRGR
jgi:hypothetical protein